MRNVRPSPPPPRLVSGTRPTCRVCGSDMMLPRWLVFGDRPGCIQELCSNYGGVRPAGSNGPPTHPRPPVPPSPPRPRVKCESPEDLELLEGMARDYGRAQQMLREVELHWSGRPLVESVREAVDEIKRLRGEQG